MYEKVDGLEETERVRNLVEITRNGRVNSAMAVVIHYYNPMGKLALPQISPGMRARLHGWLETGDGTTQCRQVPPRRGCAVHELAVSESPYH
jgi:hypothetical protein